MPPITPNTQTSSDGQNVITVDSGVSPVAHEPLHVPHKPASETTVPKAEDLVFADLIPQDTPSIPSTSLSQPPLVPPPPPAVTPPAEFTVTHVPVESDAPTKTEEHREEKIADAVAVSPSKTVASVPVIPLVEKTPETREDTVLEKIAKEEARVRSLEERRKHTQSDSERLFLERKELEDGVAPLLLDEKLAMEQIDALEKKKNEASTPSLQREIETERWKVEEKRRAIEDAKWPLSEKLEAVVAQIKEGESAFKELLAEELASTSRIAKLRTEAKQLDLKRELESITREREATEAELEQYRLLLENLESELHDTKESDAVALQAEHVVDAKADTARTLYEERVLAEERHKLEKERQEAEKKRWEAEDAIPDVTHSVEESEARLRAIKQEEDGVLARLRALDA